MPSPNHLSYAQQMDNGPSNDLEGHRPPGPSGLPPGGRDECRPGTGVPTPSKELPVTGLPYEVGVVVVRTGLPAPVRPGVRQPNLLAQEPTIVAGDKDATVAGVQAGGEDIVGLPPAPPGSSGPPPKPPNRPPAGGDSEDEPPSDDEPVAYPYEPGEGGIPLDRIRRDMEASGAVRVTDEVPGGSGELISCKLDKDYSTGLEEEQRPAYYVEARDGLGHAMYAMASVPEQTMDFGVYTDTENAPRSPDFYAARFVEWSLGTFEKWGANIQYIDDMWFADSDNYEQFQQAMNGNEANIEDAAKNTWSGRLVGRLGFTEVETINVGLRGEGQLIEVRFSKPEAPEAPPPTEPDRPDDEGPDEAVGVTGNGIDDIADEPTGGWSSKEELQAAIETYLAQPERILPQGEPLQIPLSGGSITFVKAEVGWTTDSDAATYVRSLFPDDTWAGMWVREPALARPPEHLEMIAGGIDEALGSDRVVLDIASGEARALLELARAYQKTTFIGVDSGYSEVREIQIGKPGVQLTKDSWDRLSTLASGSIHTILSSNGPFMHGDPTEFIPALSRVAAPGAILRFNVGDILSRPTATPEREFRSMRTLLRQNGWELTSHHSLIVGVKREIGEVKPSATTVVEDDVAPTVQPAPRQAEIVDYLDKKTTLGEGGQVTIPTTTGDPMLYTKRQEHWNTNSDLRHIKNWVFSDEFEPGWDYGQPMGTIFAPIARADQSDTLAGGLDGACAPGKTVLEIASGEARALHELGLQFPNTTFIGVDAGYSEARAVHPGEPGIQLTRSDWNTLREVPDDSVDTIFSYLGVFMHQKPLDDTLQAITRVAKPGAVLRFEVDDLGRETVKMQEVRRRLWALGWATTIKHNTVIGLKRA